MNKIPYLLLLIVALFVINPAEAKKRNILMEIIMKVNERKNLLMAWAP